MYFTKQQKKKKLTRSFFFLSGVMKPFFAFFAFEASSIRLRTSARLRSISVCLAFFAYIHLQKIQNEKNVSKIHFNLANMYVWMGVFYVRP